MTQIVYPGVVLANTPFSWYIADVPGGTAWEVKTFNAAGALLSTNAATQPATARTDKVGLSLPLGKYVIQVRAGDYAANVPVQSIANWEFIWRADPGAAVPVKPRVRMAQFGDGYSQALPDGLNHMLSTYNLNFSRLTDVEAMQIELFLQTMGGTAPFRWKTPNGLMQRFRCAEWNVNYGEIDDHSISAVFTQVP
jgi:phage-related protein